MAALQALAADPARYGMTEHPLAVAGDSAGGNLAAVTALRLQHGCAFAPLYLASDRQVDVLQLCHFCGALV